MYGAFYKQVRMLRRQNVNSDVGKEPLTLNLLHFTAIETHISSDEICEHVLLGISLDIVICPVFSTVLLLSNLHNSALGNWQKGYHSALPDKFQTLYKHHCVKTSSYKRTSFLIITASKTSPWFKLSTLIFSNSSIVLLLEITKWLNVNWHNTPANKKTCVPFLNHFKKRLFSHRTKSVRCESNTTPYKTVNKAYLRKIGFLARPAG